MTTRQLKTRTPLNAWLRGICYSRLCRAVCTLVCVAIVWTVPAAERRLNILLLYADDWRHDSIGCAGNPVVKTPNIDRLASQGVRFDRACVTTSICGVSRASLLTGQWMSRHGNEGFAMFRTPWAETFPGLLRTSGYWVGHVGKWHNGKFPGDHYDFGRSYMGTHWIKQPGGGRVHVTKKNEVDALEFLRTRPKEQPFCLTVAFFAAHAEDPNPEQFLPQPESMALYTDLPVPVPALATETALHRLPPFLQQPANEGRVRWKWRFDTPEKYQRMMKNYYRLCTEVDAVCGTLVEELKKQGVLDETLVIFTTDNGYFHGDRLLADKWYPYEESIRVPLVVVDPRMKRGPQGRVQSDFVLNVDLAPTILAAAGVGTPGTMQGRDFSPLYLTPDKPLVPAWRQEFFYEHATITSSNRIPTSHALVRKDLKYTHWPEFDYEELFDLRSDPLEQENLAADPTRKADLEKARVRMRELQARAR